MLSGSHFAGQVNSSLLQKIMADSKLMNTLKSQSKLQRQWIDNKYNSRNSINLSENDNNKDERKAGYLWENVMKWISFAEECLFILPPPSVSYSSPKARKVKIVNADKPSKDSIPPLIIISADTTSEAKVEEKETEKEVEQEKEESQEAPNDKDELQKEESKTAKQDKEDLETEGLNKPTETITSIDKTQNGVHSKPKSMDNASAFLNLDNVSEHFLLKIHHTTDHAADKGFSNHFQHLFPPAGLRSSRSYLRNNNKNGTTSSKSGLQEQVKTEKERPKWTDFHFAQRLLDLIDNVLLFHEPDKEEQIPFAVTTTVHLFFHLYIFSVNHFVSPVMPRILLRLLVYPIYCQLSLLHLLLPRLPRLHLLTYQSQP